MSAMTHDRARCSRSRTCTVEFGDAAASRVAARSTTSTCSVDAGEVVGIVGESGSGKSVTALALMGLIDAPGRVRAERLALRRPRPAGDAASASGARCSARDIAMIFQDPMTSLNPCFTVALPADRDAARCTKAARAQRAARARARAAASRSRSPIAERRLDAYPHQLSGGMSQRVMIAMAIACNPRLLIADEPTTALDVTVQAQMLALLLRLQRERGMALVLITHDLGVVAEVAQRVVVMYAGQVVESAAACRRCSTRRAIRTPRRCSPRCPSATSAGAGCASIAGVVPGAFDRPAGCLLSPRCPYVQRALPRRRGRRCSTSAPARGALLLSARARSRRP